MRSLLFFMGCCALGCFETTNVQAQDIKRWEDLDQKLFEQRLMDSLKNKAAGTSAEEVSKFVDMSEEPFLKVTKNQTAPFFSVELVAKTPAQTPKESEARLLSTRKFISAVLGQNVGVSPELVESSTSEEDGVKLYKESILQVQVAPKNQAPTVANPPRQSVMESTPVNLKIEAQDPDGDSLWYSSTDLPAGLSIDAKSGLISGKPSQEGKFESEVVVSDSRGGAGTVTISWEIKENIGTNPFAIPAGLTMDFRSLLTTLGYTGGHCNPSTVEVCLEMAIKSIRCGLYQDAIALANHGLIVAQSPELYFIRGVAECGKGDCDSSVDSMKALKAMKSTATLDRVKERLSGPLATRFQIALKVFEE